MPTPINYRNAYKEVYTILQFLEEREYSKIPVSTIKAIKLDMNNEYEFQLKRDIELKDQELLPETRAILFNLFRDYLSEPWQREKILKWQNEERIRNDELKKQKYNVDIFKKEDSNINSNNSIKFENTKLIEYKENIFRKIFNFIKNLFKKKGN